MKHRAFAFRWDAFEQELRPTLERALEADDRSDLIDWIESHRKALTDPYEGDPLPQDWQRLLEVGDVDELGDFALTCFYDVKQDMGLADRWLEATDVLEDHANAALLGSSLEVVGRVFDPGRMGSYFQSPQQAAESRLALRDLRADVVEPFRSLLETCFSKRLGVYVTF